MLKEIGFDNIEELFSDIPKEIRLNRKLDIPKLSELELDRHMKFTLSKNSPYTRAISFLGGGVWPHYVPAHVREIVRRSEFLTSYTPYQAEASQGMLQALFEYQSFISELTGLEVSNASTYDWASALGEAALMTTRITKRDKFLVPEFISPPRLSVLKNYATPAGIEIVKIPQDHSTGQIDLSKLEEKISEDTAGVYIENPSYLGFLETQPNKIADITREENALFVVGVNPISLGLLKPPGDYGADIVVGEGQPLGNPVSFGGPALGIFACRGERKFIRQLPGRLIGMTTEEEGKTRGFSMVLQTREQHIRRERATSSICTNQSLCAVAAAVYLASLGPSGLRDLAKSCAGSAQYAMEKLNSLNDVKAPIFDAPHFNEFTVSLDESSISTEEAASKLLSRGIHAGKPIDGEFPELENASLWCTTELHSKEDIDWLVTSLKEILEGTE
ncbi:hypothetical protein AKJ35_00960 [candidate division MSBL1 archaeon SCGC-AAA833F18]|uniref:Probable glycine dehydrogenase (decarboxylating) subunit 1 n=1 Tax=candidate division MSBL1 archaeon SCGC-AAA833F18 TaxID=1698257 RepID=A0A133VSE0_9EURY|nr:hypothetical protein AKJ35_00960 [candidate division MSBL1 archaeon SCGC-AAA833F18]